jgi:hypothetical protein
MMNILRPCLAALLVLAVPAAAAACKPENTFAGKIMVMKNRLPDRFK